jgi:hypothetical protein
MLSLGGIMKLPDFLTPKPVWHPKWTKSKKFSILGNPVEIIYNSRGKLIYLNMGLEGVVVGPFHVLMHYEDKKFYFHMPILSKHYWKYNLTGYWWRLILFKITKKCNNHLWIDFGRMCKVCGTEFNLRKTR